MLMNSNFANGTQAAAAQLSRQASPSAKQPPQQLNQLNVLSARLRGGDSLAALAFKANLMTRQEIDEAREIALSLSQSVDQVIVTSSFITQDQFSKLESAFYYMERELCTESLAICGLNMACKKHLSFEEGMRYFGWGW